MKTISKIKRKKITKRKPRKNRKKKHLGGKHFAANAYFQYYNINNSKVTDTKSIWSNKEEDEYQKTMLIYDSKSKSVNIQLNNQKYALPNLVPIRAKSTIVIFIYAHGAILKYQEDVLKNVPWFSQLPLKYFNLGGLYDDSKTKHSVNYFYEELVKIYSDIEEQETTVRKKIEYKEDKFPNHFKNLQKLLETEMYDTLTINQYMTSYVVDMLDSVHALEHLHDNYTFIDYKIVMNSIISRRFRYLNADKFYQFSDIGSEPGSSTAKAEDFCINVVYHDNIRITDDKNTEIDESYLKYIFNDNKLLIKYVDDVGKTTYLSSIIKQLKGIDPFPITEDDGQKKNIFLHFDNVFVYDISCNVVSKLHPVSGEFISSEFVEGDVEGKHNKYDFMERYLEKFGKYHKDKDEHPIIVP